jgi:Toxin PAAR-like domain
MACTVFANSRGVSHKGSGGMSTVFPDVCKTPTPGGPIPIPYPNIGKSSDTSSGPSSVKSDGEMPMTKDANYMMSTGDEAGSAMGVVSNKVKGKCEYMMYSFDVKYEGNHLSVGRPGVSQRQEHHAIGREARFRCAFCLSHA